MYSARSPTSSSRYRRRSSTASNHNYRVGGENNEEHSSSILDHNHHPTRHQLVRQHCRCCSMSTGDLAIRASNDSSMAAEPSSGLLASFELREAAAIEEAGGHHQHNHCPHDHDHHWTLGGGDNDETNSIKTIETPTTNRRRTPTSRQSSIVSTLSSPNILLLASASSASAGTDYQHSPSSQQPMNENIQRLRDRLSASVAGLKELDLLREKHRRMVEDVKAQLRLSNETVTNGYSNGQSNGGATAASVAPRSPSPAELSSNISHRSSLSMDSGVCLSLSSDPSIASNGYSHHLLRPMSSAYYHHPSHHGRRLSTDSSNGYHHNHPPTNHLHHHHLNNNGHNGSTSYLSPARKSSWTMSSASALYDALANAAEPSSDDEGCCSSSNGHGHHNHHRQEDPPRPYSSLASITAALAAVEASVLPSSSSSRNGTHHAAPLRYRRRGGDGIASSNGSGASMAPSRPRSLYNSYPEENMVTVLDALMNGGVTPLSPRQHQQREQQQQAPNMRVLRRTSVQYRPQVPTIMANLAEPLPPPKPSMIDPWDSSANSVVSRRRPNGVASSRGVSAVDPVFRASRVFIDTLPEHDLDDDLLLRHNGSLVAMRARRYESANAAPPPVRRPRPTSMAVPPSVSTPVLNFQYNHHHSYSPSPSLKKQNSAPGNRSPPITWDEAKRILDPSFGTRSSSSSTLVRQHSTASSTIAGGNGGTLTSSKNGTNGARPSPKATHRRRHASSKSPVLDRHNHPTKSMMDSCTSMINVSVVTTTGDASCCSSDGGISDPAPSVLVVNNGHDNDQQRRTSVSRSISSQSSDSNKSRRQANKEKIWRESPQL